MDLDFAFWTETNGNGSRWEWTNYYKGSVVSVFQLKRFGEKKFMSKVLICEECHDCCFGDYNLTVLKYIIKKLLICLDS